MRTSGRADGKAPFCLEDFVTPNGKGGLTDACADGKPVLILALMRLTEKLLVLKNISEQPIEIRLVFVWDYIRFLRFSPINPVHNCGFAIGRIWGESVERCAVPKFENSQLVTAFLMKHVNLFTCTHVNRCDYACGHHILNHKLINNKSTSFLSVKCV